MCPRHTHAEHVNRILDEEAWNRLPQQETIFGIQENKKQNLFIYLFICESELEIKPFIIVK